MRRVGVLMLHPEDDPQGQLRATAFRQGFEKLGWGVGRNVQIDFSMGLGRRRLGYDPPPRVLRLAPDVILANLDAIAGRALPAMPRRSTHHKCACKCDVRGDRVRRGHHPVRSA
jgi:hypothetical protein